MQSFLIVSKNPKQTEGEWKKLCDRFKIDPLDQIIIESEQTLGIEDIRQIQKTIFTAPARGKTKGIFLRNAHTLTIPGQNAFLKLLEEPPRHAIIVLQTANKDSLLPTILSRCFLIETTNGQKTAQKSLSSLAILGLKERMELAEKMGQGKEAALSFLEEHIISQREELKKAPTNQNAHIIKQLQRAYTIIETTNVNPRFTLENTLLNL